MEESRAAPACPDCGSPLATEAWGENLCLECLLRLAAPTLHSELADDAEAPTAFFDEALSQAATAAPEEPAEVDATMVSETAPIPSDRPKPFEFSSGQVLGERYRVLKMLGRGGMGEVWRAYDLKLRMDVALKSLHLTQILGERGIEMLRNEVRAAREVISPNVCRLFDIIEIEGQELVSMEYIDGETLLDLLKDRGPLDMQEAREIGSQFLAGLEAIHQADLVHRDIKPENIMLTRSGRVVIMDFGLTSTSGEGELSGTPAYMAPEQGRGEGTDARADVFSAGMVLSEMLSAEHGPEDSSRISFWENVRKDPPELPPTPWTKVLLPAVATDREDRYASAAELARVLDEVTVRVEGAEEMTPYPGLESFSEDAAKFFFGREAEVEALWKKLQQAYLLGLVGASGSGKSSFVNAGLVPARPDGWGYVQMKPGREPFAALAQALADAASEADAGVLPALAGTREGTAPSDAVLEAALQDWRALHSQGLLIIDQFEELFTQNPPEVQERFAALLSRAALKGDVHVLLSMRDDFLLRCHDFDGLDPMFSELTPLKPPMGSALRRALTQPALRLGYRFEDDGMVEEMLGEVTKERGALPLIAFTAARLWDERDPEDGLLTRAAYDRMGGVSGALAQHAEATLDRIGRDRAPLVRELFRNLVTAQGTRAVMEVDEVLSVFDDDRSTAADVLQSLVDARLLTSYEIRTSADQSRERRVEVVHESLLSAWPRLVRWRMQDAEGAQLRDELRQAAKLWDTRGRAEDLLWIGTAFREFELWRERYPGRLTAVEEDFAAAMVERAERARKRKRNVLAAVMIVLLAVVAGVTTLWQQSEVARQRAEAQKLIAIGQLDIETFPTSTLAHATRSLQLADTEEGRLLALRALQNGPPAWHLPEVGFGYAMGTRFSPDGEYLVYTAHVEPGSPLVRLVRSDGTWQVIEAFDVGGNAGANWQTEDLFLTMNPFREEGSHWTLFSASEARALGEALTPRWTQFAQWDPERGRLVAFAPDGEVLVTGMKPGEKVRSLGKLPFNYDGLAGGGRWVATRIDGDMCLVEVLEGSLGEPRVLGRHEDANELFLSAEAGLAVSRDPSGEIRLWDMSGNSPPRVVEGPAGGGRSWSKLDPSGSLYYLKIDSGSGELERWVLSIPEMRLRRLAEESGSDPVFDPRRRQLAMLARQEDIQLQRLDAPEGALSIKLQTGLNEEVNSGSFHPSGDWFASGNGLFVWDVSQPYPIRLDAGARRIAFDALGRGLLGTLPGDTPTVSWWPLEGDILAPRRDLFTKPDGGVFSVLAVSPDGKRVLAGKGRAADDTGPVLFSFDDGSTELLEDGFHDQIMGVAFSPDGRYAAASGGQMVPEERFIKVWDLETLRLVATHAPEERISHTAAGFTHDNRALWSSTAGLYAWNFTTGDHEKLVDGYARLHPSADGTILLIGQASGRDGMNLTVLDLETGSRTPMTTHGTIFRSALDPAGHTVASITRDGVLRIGPVSGEEPHVFQTEITTTRELAIDPLGRWVAITGGGETSLWPIPPASEPPLHTLPHDELIAKLESLTNARLLKDPESSSGWKLGWAPFPGWRQTSHQ